MTPATDLRWGLLGASRILQRAILPAIQTAPGQTALALAARDPARARATAAAFGIPHPCETYADLLARPDIDAVYISLVNDLHFPWTLQALAAGKHVLCEKPLALSASEVRTMQAAATAAGRLVMEAFCYGFHPQIEAALAAMAAGAIGKIVSVEAQFSNPLPSPDDYRWQARHGGGALLDLGTYCVSLIRAVTGREPSRVAGSMTPRGDVDASFRAMLDFGDCGAIFACSFDGYPAQSCRIIGTSGILEIEVPFSSKAKRTRTLLSGTVTEWSPCDPYRGMIEHFAAAIQTGQPLRHGPAEALRHATVLDALLHSAPVALSRSPAPGSAPG